MPFLSYEQSANGPRIHAATWSHPREGADWLKERSRAIEEPDLYLANPVAKAYFAEVKLAAGEPVTWTVGSGQNTIYLTVEPMTGHPGSGL